MGVTERLAEIAAHPPSEWRARLEAAFPNDPALVAQSLLWLAASERPPVLDERYRLAARLDAGASAEVWQAFDRKLGRHVAIKLFHAEQAPALAEARAACDVISDHVVRVLDVFDRRPPLGSGGRLTDEAGGTRPYIVMELVGEQDQPGASAAVLRPHSIEESVRWVRDVARGVHDAHLRDVFHRDLKPQNVLITPLSRRARIADFGLAAHGGSFAGTPEYMAPEAARGLPSELDRAQLVAIDVWGLGALAYDLIGGAPPWRGPGEAWERAATGEPPPALAAPPRLRRVIDKAMAAQPEARYASAAALGDELDAYLARRPTSLDRSKLLRAWLWSRRNPQLSMTGAAAVVLATLTLASYLAVRDLRDRAHDLAIDVAQEEAANRDAEMRAAATKRDLAGAEQRLATLQRELADEESQYRAIIAARDKALHDADAATRALVDQLTIARSDRAAAELGRSMYEGFWRSARGEADRNAKDRDQAQTERDAARGERDQLSKERDAARAERDHLQHQLETAQADVARLTAEAAASSARIIALERQIAGTPVDAGVHD